MGFGRRRRDCNCDGDVVVGSTVDPGQWHDVGYRNDPDVLDAKTAKQRKKGQREREHGKCVVM